MRHSTEAPEKVNDVEIAEDIRLAMIKKNVHRLRRVDVQVEDGSVVVTGNVSTFYEKQLATSCCWQTAGIRRVVNELVVDEFR